MKVFQEFLADSSSMLPGRAGTRLMLPERAAGPFSWLVSRLLWKLDWAVAADSRSGYRGAGK